MFWIVVKSKLSVPFEFLQFRSLWKQGCCIFVIRSVRIQGYCVFWFELREKFEKKDLVHGVRKFHIFVSTKLCLVPLAVRFLPWRSSEFFVRRMWSFFGHPVFLYKNLKHQFLNKKYDILALSSYLTILCHLNITFVRSSVFLSIMCVFQPQMQ
jgi:hypothetical protein